MNGVENKQEVSAISGLRSEISDIFEAVKKPYNFEDRGISRANLRKIALAGGAIVAMSIIAGADYLSTTEQSTPRKVVAVGILAAGAAFGGHILRSAGRALAQLRNHREETQTAEANAAMDDLDAYTEDRRFDVN